MSRVGWAVQLAAAEAPQDLYIDQLAAPYQPWAALGVPVDEPTFLVKDQVDVTLTPRSTVRIDVPRSGDWLLGAVLVLRIPALAGASPGTTWTPKLAYRLFDRIRFVIDDVLVADNERLWYDLYDQVFDSRSITRLEPLSATSPHTLYVPLRLGVGSTAYARDTNPLPLGQLAAQARVQVHVLTSSFAGLNTAGTAGDVSGFEATVIFDYMLTPPAPPVRAMVYSAVRDADSRPGAASVLLDRLNGPVTGLVFASYQPGTNFQYDKDDGRLVVQFGPDDVVRHPVGAFYGLSKMYSTSTDVAVANVGYVELATPWVDFARVRNPSASFGVPGATHKVFACLVQYLAFGAGTVRLGFVS